MFLLRRKKHLEKREQQWQEEKQLIERQKKLQQQKKALKPRKKLTTTKLLILYLFGSCSAIQIFTCYVTCQSLQVAKIIEISPDFSPLTTLVGAIVAQVVGFAIYIYKASKQNCAGGITFEAAASHHFKESEGNG